MKSKISKHWTNKSYNSPLCQEKSFSANLAVDKESKSLNPSLSIGLGRFSAETNANISKGQTNYNAGLNYNKGGFSAGIGVSGVNKDNPNVTANVGFKKTF